MIRIPSANLPRASRVIVTFTLAVFAFILFLGGRRIRNLPEEVLEQHAVKQSHGVYRIPKGALPSVNLVVAATSKEDTAWTKSTDLKVPGMKVLHYIADNTSAQYHADMNKGHEAMMYHKYFYDFYDDLPDISILIHSQASSWHVDTLLEQSMVFSINNLDLREVQRRRFANLRVTWGFGCTNGHINTTRVSEESGDKPEQKEMQEAFRANFNIYEIPEILATPCCSQIAVTKERILSVPREQYARHIDWLKTTSLSDAISGRCWEHMWQYLFLQKDIDCPIEHKVYCRLYHICFGGPLEYDEWVQLHQGVDKMKNELKKLNELEKEEEKKKSEDKDYKPPSEAIIKANKKLKDQLEEEMKRMQEAIRVRKEIAMAQGSLEANRVAEGEGLYGDDFEPGAEKALIPVETPTPLPQV